MVRSGICAAPLRSGALALVLIAAGATAVSAEERSVVFVGWGGSLQKVQREVFFTPFEKATGIHVTDIPDVNYAKLRAMAEVNDVKWDVVQALGMWIKPGTALGLWDTLDYTVIDRSGVPDFMVRPNAIGNSSYGEILAYNTKAFPVDKAPKTWADFWNDRDFPGPRGMLDAPRYNFEIALQASGVPKDRTYPIDMDRALASLNQVKPNVHVWWKQWPQGPQLLAAQEIVMTLTAHTRIADIRAKENAPVGMSWQGSLMTLDFLCVLKNTPHRDAAMQLVAWMTRPDLQAEFARKTFVGPTNEKALALLSEAEREQLPTAHYQRGEMVAIDNDWWADNLSLAEERWNSWKLK